MTSRYVFSAKTPVLGRLEFGRFFLRKFCSFFVSAGLWRARERSLVRSFAQLGVRGGGGEIILVGVSGVVNKLGTLGTGGVALAAGGGDAGDTGDTTLLLKDAPPTATMAP